MFQLKQWPAQDYWNSLTRPVVMGGGLGNAVDNFPTSVNSANFIKRQIVKSVLEGKLQPIDLSPEDLASATMMMDDNGEEALYIPHRPEPRSSPQPTEAAFLTVAGGMHTPVGMSSGTLIIPPGLTNAHGPVETGQKK